MDQKTRFRLIENQDWRDARVRTRTIPAHDDAPALEFLEARPKGEASGPPLFFIHGAFGGAWTWNEIFLPHLVRRGRDVAAFSIRGHGASGGYDRLRHWSLADYVADVRRAYAQLPEPPVVVAHSLGGLLAQMLIGRIEMRGLVLLGSLPPDGLLFVGPRLMMTDPHIWTEALLGSTTKTQLPITTAAQQILFSEGLPRERIARYSSLMTPESPRALAEAHMPGPVLSASLFRLPTLVMNGDLDRLVWRPSAIRTSLYHGGEYRTASGMGHFLQLDPGAERVADEVVDWIDRQVP